MNFSRTHRSDRSFSLMVRRSLRIILRYRIFIGAYLCWRWKSFSRNFVTNFLPKVFVICVVA